VDINFVIPKEEAMTKMLCSNCSNPVDLSDRLCKNCGHPVQQIAPSVITKTGKESLNIGVGNLPNANIHIGDRYETQKKAPKEIAYIRRTSTQELKIGNTSLKTSWFTLVGAVGSIASIISAFADLDFLGVNQIYCLPLVSIFFIPLIFGFWLNRIRFLNLGIFNRNIEAGADGRIYITKVDGTCPKCGSELRLIRVGPENQKRTIVACRRNPSQHCWDFDPTILSDL
jgi:hypothetical protein